VIGSLVAGCATSQAPQQSYDAYPDPTFAPVTPETFSPITTVPPGREEAATKATSTPAEHMLDLLVVVEEPPRMGYERDLFGEWADIDADGCDTACETYLSQRHANLPGIPDGGWRSPYDGVTSNDPTVFQIDHVVALAEAWDSGASNWTPQQRNAFYNDQDAELLLVTAESNQSKSDRDPAEWQPESRDSWCDFATRWTAVKVRYSLTADQAEVDVLRTMLRQCTTIDQP
jgi:hypothetical protein